MIRSKTIVVLESNEALLSEWKKALAGHEGWDLAYMGEDGEEGLRQICLLKPDLVISGASLKGTDIFDVLRTIRREGLRTKTIVTGMPSDTMMGKAIDEGAYRYLVRPFSEEDAIASVENALNGCEDFITRREHLKAVHGRIGNVLIAMHIPPHLKGYTYMCDLLVSAVERRSVINQIVEMYKTLGKRYETKWKNVDRALRHVIEVAWKRRLKDSIKEIFSASACCWEEKPPVKEFVAFVSDNLAFENIA